MHGGLTPLLRKRLVDPAACGVRLGVELRAAAEREAYGSGMCLSHWIKKLVEQALTKSPRFRKGHLEISQHIAAKPQSDLPEDELDSEFAQEMEKLNDR